MRSYTEELTVWKFAPLQGQQQERALDGLWGEKPTDSHRLIDLCKKYAVIKRCRHVKNIKSPANRLVENIRVYPGCVSYTNLNKLINLNIVSFFAPPAWPEVRFGALLVWMEVIFYKARRHHGKLCKLFLQKHSHLNSWYLLWSLSSETHALLLLN